MTHHQAPARRSQRLAETLRIARLDLGGAVMSLVFVYFSLTPSMLPRPLTGQGIISGIALAVGYSVGVLLWAALRLVGRWMLRRGYLGQRALWLRSHAWWLVGFLWLAAVVVLAGLAVEWQNGIREIIGMPRIDGFSWLRLVLAALGTALMLLAIAKLIRAWHSHLYRRFVPVVRHGRHHTALTTSDRWLGGFLALTVVATASVVAVLAFLIASLTVLERQYQALNSAPDPALAAPASALRSGGPGSLIAWEDVGYQGSIVLASGPSAAQIEALTDADAREPIRVFVGLASAQTHTARAALAVQELERTLAADRHVVVVAAPTGTGWLFPQGLDSLEYLYSGDTALVSVQYASAPSWRARFLTPERAEEGMTALFTAVRDWWEKLPADERPLLLVYGHSLGSLGIQAAFPDLDSLRAQTDGAVFVGTPAGTPLFEQLTAARDPGTPVTAPVLDGGTAVRWASQVSDFPDPADPTWEQPRVVYVNHGDDPVVWMNWGIYVREPEWLQPGQRSPEVSPHMRWLPILTGLQGGIDFGMGQAVPDNYGHKYGDATVQAWLDVIGEPPLSADAVAAIRAKIRSYDTLQPVDQ